MEHLRDKLGCSLSDLCKKIGVSRTHVYYLKNGNQEPTNKMLARLEAAERSAGIANGNCPVANNEGKANEFSGPDEKKLGVGDDGKEYDHGDGKVAALERRIMRLELALEALIDLNEAGQTLAKLRKEMNQEPTIQR